MYSTPNDLGLHLGNEYLSGLKICHLNAQSAKKKHEILEAFFSNFSFEFDLIMLSETWFTDENVFKMPHYNVFYLNRLSRRGGGVSILVKNTHQCELLHDFCSLHSDFEILTLKLFNNAISLVYRPPNGNYHTFLDYLENFFLYCNRNKLHVVCGGDYNIDLLTKTPACNELVWLYESLGLSNAIDLPTRITTSSSTLIDS